VQSLELLPLGTRANLVGTKKPTNYSFASTLQLCAALQEQQQNSAFHALNCAKFYIFSAKIKTFLLN